MNESQIAWFFIVALAVVVIAIYFIMVRILAPIKELQKAATRVAAGDFTVRIHQGRGGLHKLSNSFNDMTRQLQSLFAESTAQKEALKAIVSSIREGLLVVREDGTIVLCNDAARNFAGVELSEGKPYWETLRNPFIAGMIKSSFESKNGSINDAEINSRQYLVSTTFSAIRNEVVVVMFDVTNVKNFEIMKKELVTNASHELMTPLTAIRGFLETMRGATKKESAQYLDIIDKHTSRLTRIVGDLLSLSKMHENGFRMDSNPVDLVKIVGAVTSLLEGPARAKNLELIVKLTDGPVIVLGDQFRLEQVFVNLLDNAIKYTDKGSVSVALAKEGSNAVVRVCDTGIGIPREIAGRIFERFFVVDKSRSRQSGGTGLGLSIVKHTVLMHNGTIDVQSLPAGGSCFTVTLPLQQ